MHPIVDIEILYLPFHPTGGAAKSILTTMASPATVKRTSLGGNPVIVKHVSTPAHTQGQILSSPAAAATTVRTVSMPQVVTPGEQPKKIEKSELSPSTELNVETDT